MPPKIKCKVAYGYSADGWHYVGEFVSVRGSMVQLKNIVPLPQGASLEDIMRVWKNLGILDGIEIDLRKTPLWSPPQKISTAYWRKLRKKRGASNPNI